MKLQFYVETWILFLGTKKEVANVVKEAYKHFEDIRRFSNKKNEWKIKLISLNGKQVLSSPYIFFLFYLLNNYKHAENRCFIL